MGLGLDEIFLILIIAFFVVGPDDLPKIARFIGKIYFWVHSSVKNWTEEITRDIEVQDETKTIHQAISSFEDGKESFQKTVSEVKREL